MTPPRETPPPAWAELVVPVLMIAMGACAMLDTTAAVWERIATVTLAIGVGVGWALMPWDGS
jgi:hypothetical protein